MTVYLAYSNGVFRTDDVGKTWTPLHKGLIDTKIRSIAATQDTVFARTHKGLYRLNDNTLNGNTWKQVSIDQENMQGKTLDISALAVSENHLYVAAQKVEEYSCGGISFGLEKVQDLILNDVKIPTYSRGSFITQMTGAIHGIL